MTLDKKEKDSEPILPAIFVIFGITGHLAGKKLLPALLALYTKGMLPSKFFIVGFSRRQFSREEFRDVIRENMTISLGQFKEEDVKHFIDHIEYISGLFDDKDAYIKLKQKLDFWESKSGQCSHKLFHLAVPPNLYEPIIKNLGVLNMHEPCDKKNSWVRILVEKPFGGDMEEAVRLEKLMINSFKEDQIFRIDHYLAKESIQNILTFRFANFLFENIWDRRFIKSIYIKLLEKDGVEGRGEFYDKMGALKDIGQNHVLQMLAAVAMEKPESFKAEDLRKERVRVLKKLKIMSPKEVRDTTIRGQYEGYKKEKGVHATSLTETYFLTESYINNSRWEGVPFYLESGKALKEDKAEISVYFKEDKDSKLANILVFRIQPDEGIKIRFWAKKPGFPRELEPRVLSFKYIEGFDNSISNAYEKLLYDAILGDQTLFMTTDEVIYTWKYITSILTNWGSIPLLTYKKGSLGPLF